MSLLAKIFVVIQAVLVMVYLGMSATLYQHRREWRTSYAQLKHRHETAMGRAQKEIRGRDTLLSARNDLIAAKETEIRDYKNKANEALASMQDAKSERDKARQMVQDEKRANDTLNKRLQSVDSELSKTRSDLERLGNEFTLATRRREVAEGQVARLTALVTNLEQDNSDLRGEFASTRRKLKEAETMIAMAQEAGFDWEATLPSAPVPVIRGKVVAVKSDVSPPLVVLDVGSDAKVRPGYAFSIHRNGKYKGRVIVERTLRDMASCRVEFAAEGAQISAGDDAATRLQ
ncbi:MAG: hypothetical protein R3F62_15500 [Planctomycetota bacterium]